MFGSLLYAKGWWVVDQTSGDDGPVVSIFTAKCAVLPHLPEVSTARTSKNPSPSLRLVNVAEPAAPSDDVSGTVAGELSST